MCLAAECAWLNVCCYLLLQTNGEVYRPDIVRVGAGDASVSEKVRAVLASARVEGLMAMGRDDIASWWGGRCKLDPGLKGSTTHPGFIQSLIANRTQQCFSNLIPPCLF